MNSKKHLTLVIFGATGNLYADKLVRALYLLFLEDKLLNDFRDFKIIAFARRDLNNQDFRDFTTESILKRGVIDMGRLDEFLSHIEYFKGDFSNKNDYVRLKDSISNGRDGLVIFHLATASLLYQKIFENIKDAELHSILGKVRIMIEKPFGRDESSAKNLQSNLLAVFKEEQIFHVDHYLAKETAQAILDFKLEKNSNEKIVEKIKVIFHESNTVGSRGASYDAVGAFRDVGQNHMLQLLALTTIDKSSKLDAENIRASRLNALKDLFIDYTEEMTKKIVRAQYENYHREPNVRPDSKTETFFRVFLKSKNPNLSDVTLLLEGGKGLIDMHSDITTTTVAVQVHFTKGEKKDFKIQPVPDTIYESYIKVYNDVLKGDQTDFPSIEEIIAEWKLADELLEKWKDIPLVIYKKGAEADEIQ